MNDRTPVLRDALLETLIPADESRGMPGAGSLDLGADVAAGVDAGALAALEAAAERADFGALVGAARERWLREAEAEDAGFVGALYFRLATLYYQQPAVHRALGMRPGPPFPDGYPLEPGDTSSLERVRARGPLWRDPGD